MTLLAQDLVGRAEELGSLEHLLDELERGLPGAVELVGEPGIGKTRLLKEITVRAESRGHLVLSGSATELERDLPFSVFRDALDEYVEGFDLQRFASLDGEVQAELGHVFPSLSALAHGRDVATQQERYRSHRAVRVLLEQLARSKPLLLTLDDLQWADSASVELIGALLRRPPAAAVLIAVALRPHQTSDQISAVLERAHRASALSRIELGAMTSDEARAFLGEVVAAADVPVLYEESGGNPFYLEQLARSLERAGATSPLSGISPTDIGVPPAVAAALSEELASLSATARLVLEGASVAGDPFEPELAAAAAATSEGTATDAVDELLRLDLVRETDVPRRFRFRHPLIRRAVYESTPGGWRLGAHERCAEALAARGVAAEVRAHHVERSAHEGDLGAVAVLREAGEAAARLAPSSAARWFGAALRLLPQTSPSEERVALLLARAGSLAATGRFSESHADLLDCLEIVQRGAEASRIRVTTACVAVEHLLGFHKEAHRHLASALAELGSAKSAEAVELKIELAIDGFHAADFDAMESWAARAVAGATSLGQPELLAAALAARAMAGAVMGRGKQAQASCDEATELIDELSNEQLALHLDALANLAIADLYLDRFAAATRHARRALQIGRATGQGELYPMVVAMLGGSLWVQGKPLEAEQLFEGAVEAARLTGSVQSLAWNLFNRSFAALAAGDLDVALAAAEESFTLSEDMESDELLAFTAAVLACMLLETGETERSVELLLTRAGGEQLRLIGGGWRARFLEMLTRGLLASGRRTEAQRAAAAAEVCAYEVGLPSAAGMMNLASAALALDADEPETAAERALSAAIAFESVAALWDAARAHELAGRAFARAGDHDRAVRELDHAAAAFDSFGSLRFRDQAERELRKLGHHVHRRSRPGTTDGSRIESLTERELQVARLVVDRKTNAQIAADLFLSKKTVETHLRNIFNKIGVTTRVELARAVEHADRTEREQAG